MNLHVIEGLVTVSQCQIKSWQYPVLCWSRVSRVWPPQSLNTCGDAVRNWAVQPLCPPLPCWPTGVVRTGPRDPADWHWVWGVGVRSDPTQVRLRKDQRTWEDLSVMQAVQRLACAVCGQAFSCWKTTRMLSLEGNSADAGCRWCSTVLSGSPKSLPELTWSHTLWLPSPWCMKYRICLSTTLAGSLPSVSEVKLVKHYQMYYFTCTSGCVVKKQTRKQVYCFLKNRKTLVQFLDTIQTPLYQNEGKRKVWGSHRSADDHHDHDMHGCQWRWFSGVYWGWNC